MNSLTPKLHQRMAEDEITCACDGLSVPDALGALLEIAARILADHGIVPGTADFDSFLIMVGRSLPPRVAQLRREALATAS